MFFVNKSSCLIEFELFPICDADKSLNCGCEITPWSWNAPLLAHYWQNGKRVYLSYYCHELYRVEAIGLKKSNYI